MLAFSTLPNLKIEIFQDHVKVFITIPTISLADIHICETNIFTFYFYWHFQVKKRTANDNGYYGSHVMQYGDVQLNNEALYLYMGTDPANDNFTYVDDNSLWPSSKAVNQRDADLLHFWHKVCITNSR